MQQGSARTAGNERRERVGLRCVKTADRVLRTVTDIVFLIILLIALYFLADTIYVFNHARTDITLPHKPVAGDISVLKEISEDCIGWITIDNTSIDYPVMQGVDNYEYLNKDPYGDYSLAGSIYLDSRNTADFTDEYSILYGHHMSGGYMFGALDDFEDKHFFDEHLNGTIITEKEELPCKVVAFLYTDASNDVIFDPEEDKSNVVDFVKGNAINLKTIAPDSRIVALTTCKSPTSTRRMILILMIDEDK